MVELVFMMLILKLPIVYLGLVCWWAIRAEPRPPEPALLPVPPADDPEPRRWTRRPGPRPRRGGPHGSRAIPPRRRRTVQARAEARR